MELSYEWYIALTIAGCLILCIIIIIVYCLWRKNKRKEVKTNEIFLENQEQGKAKQSIERLDTDRDAQNKVEVIIKDEGNEENEDNTDNNDGDHTSTDLKLTNGKSKNESLHAAKTETTIIHSDLKEIQLQQSSPSIMDENELDDGIEIVTLNDIPNHNDNDNDHNHSNKSRKVSNSKSKPKVNVSMKILLNNETLLNPTPSPNDSDTNDLSHQYSVSTVINTPPEKDSVNDDENAPTTTTTTTTEDIEHIKLKWKLKNIKNNTSDHNKAAQSHLDLLQPRSSVKAAHSKEDSFDADVDFTDNTNLDGNHGFGPSVQIHNFDSMDMNTPIEEEEDSTMHIPDALEVQPLPTHYLSDSVESLDPDFVLEAAYFENSEVYSVNSMSREDSYSIPPPIPDAVSIPIDNADIKRFNLSNHTQHTQKQNTLTVNLPHSNSHTIGVSKDLDLGGSTQWTMPGISIDHTASMQMLQSITKFKTNPNQNDNNKPTSIQYTGPKEMNIGKSIQYEAIIDNPLKKKVNEDNVHDDNDNDDEKKVVNIDSNPKSIQLTSASMGGEQFIMWQMHGRKLKNMSHEELVKWLESSGFDNDTLDHFRKYQIDGQKLWKNIRNASMFLYNVGVVRPTLRDAIVQNIYLELLPKTPGFDERHMSDFKRLQLIADGPISTVYKAIIQKEKLKLRESTVIIKGYHFAADDVRVGKIIQILVHMVTNVNSPRFVKIHGFIRNMMENNNDDNNSYQQRPMFGIVMEFCDGGSLYSMFKNGQNKHYHFEYNIMDKIGIITEIATAMSELHRKNTLHRNLKASNVLISNNDDIKLTDYCLDVTQLTDFTHSLDAKERSIRWMSPELIQTQSYTKKCDIYSFGITMYEILSGNKPYHQYQSIPDLLRRIIQENLRPNIDDLANLPEDLLVLMTKCWNENPENRPSDFDEIIDELDAIKETLRKSCITFDDIYARARISRTSKMYNYGKAFQSSPLLTMDHSNSEKENEYFGIDYVDAKFQDDDVDDDDDDDEVGVDDEKFQQLLQPYTDSNRPTHIKDDSALELDFKIKKFTPKRRKKQFQAKKKRPRKPLPKAPPVKKALPSINHLEKTIEIKPNVTRQVQLPDKPLPPKPLS